MVTSASQEEIASLPEPQRRAWNLLFQVDNLDNSRASAIKAQKLSEEALRLDPTIATGLLYLSWALKQRIQNEPERRDELLARLDEVTARAIVAAPGDLRVWVYRSEALRFQGDWNGAFAAVEQALRLDPSKTSSLIQRTTLLGLTGRGEEGLQILARAIELNPTEKDGPLSNQCWILVTLGRDRDAIAPCETGAAAYPSWFLDAYATAAYANLGEQDKAAYWKQKLLAAYPEISIKRLRGLSAIGRSRLSRATRALSGWTPKGWNSREVRPFA